jgi:Holliday junction DNA helicase RuvA
MSLGFTAKESDNAITNVVNQISEEGGDANSVELAELLKRALQKGGR